MPTPRILKALLLSALLTVATLGTASATPVYFQNDSGASGVVDVYVDGTLVYDNIFASSFMMFPRELAAGDHQVVVTPFSLAPGEQDLLQTTVNLPGSGAVTLILAESEDESGLPVLGLSVASAQTE